MTTPTFAIASRFAGFSLLAVVAACDALPGSLGGGPALFPLELVVVPEPSHSAHHQAACASTDAYDDAMAVVEAENAAIAEDRELLLSLWDATSTTVAGIATYEATVDGRSLSMTVVESDGAVVYQGSLDGQAYLSATSNDDGAEGTLTVGELSVAWSTDAARQVVAARTQGARSTAMFLGEDRVKLSLSDGTVVVWTAEAGVVLGASGLPMCWEGTEFCDAASCSEELTSAALGT
ncbi:MAG: hypothetical protein ACO3JL_07995 [Myxococcota bacterium]